MNAAININLSYQSKEELNKILEQIITSKANVREKKERLQFNTTNQVRMMITTSSFMQRP
jgi:hypothetical protein